MAEQTIQRMIIMGWNSSLDGHYGACVVKHFVPGWAKAQLYFARTDKEADELVAQDPTNRIAVNVGTGPFTGHPHGKYPNDCATALVCKHFGLADDPILARVQRLALVTDKRPVGRYITRVPLANLEERHDLSAILESTPAVTLKKMYAARRPQLEAFQYSEMTFYVECEAQKAFHQQALPEFEEKALKLEIVRDSSTICIAGVQSDNPMVQKVAQSKYGGRQQMLFQASPTTGNWAVFGLHMGSIRPVVSVVRAAEMWKTGIVFTGIQEDLEADGALIETPHLFFHEDGNQLFNGSLTHPDEPPTALTFPQIWDLIQIALVRDRRESFWSKWEERRESQQQQQAPTAVH